MDNEPKEAMEPIEKAVARLLNRLERTAKTGARGCPKDFTGKGESGCPVRYDVPTHSLALDGRTLPKDRAGALLRFEYPQMHRVARCHSAANTNVYRHDTDDWIW